MYITGLAAAILKLILFLTLCNIQNRALDISRTASICFAVLRQIRSIRRSVTRPVLLSLVLTRLDYGSATLAGLPAKQLDRLQSVLNAAARLVFSARKYDNITPLLRELHWLRVPERIQFRLAVLIFRCLND